MKHRYTQLLAIVALAAVAACGGASGGSSDGVTLPGNNPGGTNPNPNSVSLVNLTFSPATITVSAGAAVTWQWNDCSAGGGYGGYSCVSHSVTFDDGSNIASPVQSSGTFSRTFTAPGTYKYHCAIHGSAMSGQVVVQ